MPISSAHKDTLRSIIEALDDLDAVKITSIIFDALIDAQLDEDCRTLLKKYLLARIPWRQMPRRPELQAMQVALVKAVTHKLADIANAIAVIAPVTPVSSEPPDDVEFDEAYETWLVAEAKRAAEALEARARALREASAPPPEPTPWERRTLEKLASVDTEASPEQVDAALVPEEKASRPFQGKRHGKGKTR